MFSKFFKLLPLLVVVTLTAAAQGNGIIRSSVSGADSKPLADVLVSLYRTADAALVKTAFTDSLGQFAFTDLLVASYYITCDKGGFERLKTADVALNAASPEAVLPPLVLQVKSATVIDEVTVKAAAPFVQRRIDRTVVNPDALISNAGLSALEVLGKSPGVRVDAEGLISLLGRPGVVVFIDDRATHLSATDLANYLRTLPASSIQSFEIMTNPPAKYDAAGNAGVINIRMKKMTAKGFNGSANLSYGQGIYPRYNAGLIFNYRINKFNFFSSLSYNFNNVFQDLTVDRTYSKPGGGLSSIFNQHTLIKRELSGLNYKVGTDYYLSKRSTIGVVVNGFENRDVRGANNFARLYDPQPQLINTVITENPTTRRFSNISSNLNYTYKPDDKGSELSANVDVLRYESRLDQSLISSTYLADGSFLGKSNLVSNLPATIDISTAKADYIRPIKDGRIEAGAKVSFINTDNVASFFDEQNGNLTVNDDFTNSFSYKEGIQALYLSGSKDWSRVSAQLGLRYERTDISGRQYGSRVQPDSMFKRQFNNLFPTVYLQYKADSAGDHVLSFSYGRRIDRPDYQSMNPFTYPLDRFTIYSGNPFLQPTFSNNLELSYSYKSMLNATLLYSYVQNVITETISQGVNTFLSKPGNIGEQTSYGIAVDFSKQLTKFWVLQLHTELMHNANKAVLYGQELNNSGTYWYVGPINQFVLPKKWSAELSGSYQTSVPSGQFIVIPVGGVNCAISKKLLSGKLTLKLSANDIFYTNRPGGEIVALGSSTASWRSRLDTRVVTFAMSYRFSKGKNLAMRKVGAADSEKTRVK